MGFVSAVYNRVRWGCVTSKDSLIKRSHLDKKLIKKKYGGNSCTETRPTDAVTVGQGLLMELPAFSRALTII